jgi:FixJ family two-component response regulator
MTSEPAVIHVVDDDVSFRTAIARLLGSLGYQVALYESAAQLLERRPTDGRGCILLDVQMEGLNGIELQDVLAERGNILPIVFLTGHGDRRACAPSRRALRIFCPNRSPRRY